MPTNVGEEHLAVVSEYDKSRATVDEGINMTFIDMDSFEVCVALSIADRRLYKVWYGILTCCLIALA